MDESKLDYQTEIEALKEYFILNDLSILESMSLMISLLTITTKELGIGKEVLIEAIETSSKVLDG